MSLSLQYPSWYFLLCVLLGGGAAMILYFRDKQFRDLGPSFRKWIWVLAALRFLAVTFLAFLLLSPLIRSSVNRIEKPIVVFLKDNSQSVRLKGNDSAAFINELASAEKELSSGYDVKSYSFGSSLRQDGKLSFTDQTTNISSALGEVANIYTNQNLGAIILASDGIYNEGSNPVYAGEKIHAPVFSIALGDTTVRRDLILSNVLFNRSVFLGDYFPLKAEWQAQFCANETSVITVKEISNGVEKLLESKPISIEGNDDAGSSDFILKAGEGGLKHYRVSLSSVSNEASAANNTKDIFIEVHEKKEKVLILASAPHPDVAALKQAIEQTRNYEVDVSIGTEFSGNIKDYSLFIFHQLPSAGNTIQPVLQRIRDQKKSVLFILGAQSSIGMLNGSQSMLTINGNNNSTSDALPVVNGSFTLFTLPEIVKQNMNAFPPLVSPFGEYKLSAGAVSLFNQKIGNVVTGYPLILFQQDMNGRSGMIAGEGLWRWRMWDYLQHKNQDAFNALISAVVQYLAIRPDEKQFRVRLEKEVQQGSGRIFSENESVIFDAELLNESNELINEPDAFLTIKDNEGKEYPFTFSKTMNAYMLNAGFFPEGNYVWTARTRYNNKDLLASGSFTVTPTQLEFVNTRADHQVLFSLSEKTGGKLFYPTQIQELVKAIESKAEVKPVMYSTTRTEPLINLRWLMIPILLLLALEWGIRKFNGGY